MFLHKTPADLTEKPITRVAESVGAHSLGEYNGKPWRYEPPKDHAEHSEPTNADLGIKPMAAWKFVAAWVLAFVFGFAALVGVVIAMFWLVGLLPGVRP